MLVGRFTLRWPYKKNRPRVLFYFFGAPLTTTKHVLNFETEWKEPLLWLPVCDELAGVRGARKGMFW